MEIPLFSVYLFYHTLTAFNFRLLGIGDLHNVKTVLKEFNKPDWRKFGSEAGLSYITLNGIQANKTNVEDRFEECLACWLKIQDKVDEKGKPSRGRLAEILDEIGDRALAKKIRDRKGKFKHVI